MNIRKAAQDDADAIVGYLFLAMQDIVFSFIGEQAPRKATDFLRHFVERENNQYSYQNCWVVEFEGEIIAAVNVYDGAELQHLRAPVISYLQQYHNVVFKPEDETQAGELYIDSLGVSPKQQGKGTGSKLLQFLIRELVANKNQTLGLLVDKENPGAKKLYLKLGFKPVGMKTLMGKLMEHLQLKPVDLADQI